MKTLHYTICTIFFVFAISNINAQEKLPKPPQAFKGKIGKTYKDAKEDYPQEIQAPDKAPNIVVIMLDDVGFGQTGTYGGPIPTPYIDKLANNGLSYTRFHTTAICSSSRAALLTGRNHHQTGFGTISELSTGYPGYNSLWGNDATSVAEILRQNGYSTGVWGKWHNTPDWETSPAGPYDRWPTGMGFQYFYGFFGGETSQWEPQLFRNLDAVEAPKTPEEGYHLTEDLVDDATRWAKAQKSLDPNRPIMMYVATGAAHAPLHVPQEWIDKFKGQFDEGWDVMREKTLARQKQMGILPQNTKLTPRPASIPAWNDQSADAKKLYARQMEVFAGFLAHTDYYIGQLIENLGALPGMDNTMFVYIVGDNGASAEGSMTGTTNNMMTQNGFPDNVQSQLADLDKLGGPEFENHYAVPWSWAGSSPFQWMKRVPSHFGGTRNGMVISWKGHISQVGQTRTQFHHLIDIMPTLLQAANVKMPVEVNGVEQIPVAGVPMNYSFDNAKAPSTRTQQYFEVGGNIAMYKEGWIATSFHREPWLTKGTTGFDDIQWSLYNIEEDWSQANDLSKQYPEKVNELKALFDEEAQKYNVYPMDDRFAERAQNPNRPSLTKGKTHFVYYEGMKRIPEGSAAPVYARSHEITADIQYKTGDEGVLICNGGSAAGYTLFIQDNKLHYLYNYFGKQLDEVTSTTLPNGSLTLKMKYDQSPTKEYGAGGNVTLYVNGKEVGKGVVKNVAPVRYSATETMDIGMDLGSAVSHDYKVPFTYSGKINQVTVDLK